MLFLSLDREAVGEMLAVREGVDRVAIADRVGPMAGGIDAGAAGGGGAAFGEGVRGAGTDGVEGSRVDRRPGAGREAIAFGNIAGLRRRGDERGVVGRAEERRVRIGGGDVMVVVDLERAAVGEMLGEGVREDRVAIAFDVSTVAGGMDDGAAV